MRWNVGADLKKWPPGEADPEDGGFNTWIGVPTSSPQPASTCGHMTPRWLAEAANHRRTKDITAWFLHSTPEQRRAASGAGITAPMVVRAGWGLSRWNRESHMTVTAGLRLVSIAVKAKRPPRTALRERVLQCSDPRAAMMMTIRAPSVLPLPALLEWLPPSVVTEFADFILTKYGQRTPSVMEEFLIAARRIEPYRLAIGVVDVMRT